MKVNGYSPREKWLRYQEDTQTHKGTRHHLHCFFRFCLPGKKSGFMTTVLIKPNRRDTSENLDDLALALDLSLVGLLTLKKERPGATVLIKTIRRDTCD